MPHTPGAWCLAAIDSAMQIPSNTIFRRILVPAVLLVAASLNHGQVTAKDDAEAIKEFESAGIALKLKDEKLKAFNEALSRCEKTACPSTGRLLLRISGVYIDADELDAAWDYAARGMSAAEASKDRRSVERAFSHFGIVHDIRGNYTAALENYEKALAIGRELNNQADIAGSINNIGLIYMNLSNYSKAAKMFEESSGISEKIDDYHGLALSLMNLGNVHLNTGDYSGAMAIYRRSYDTELKRGGDGSAQLTNIGMVYESQGDFDQARIYFKRSLSFAEKSDRKQEVANNLVSLGRIEDSIGNFREALDLQTRALAIYRQIGFRVEVANTLDNLSLVYAKLSEFAKAESAVEEALQIGKDLGDPDTIFQVLLERAAIQILQGKLEAAGETATLAKTYFEKTGGER